jgi:hypothetical protein
MTQVVESLSSKHEAQNSIPSTVKIKINWLNTIHCPGHDIYISTKTWK